MEKPRPIGYLTDMRDISRDQLLAELRALRPEFEGRGVVHMAIFGSRARGDNRPDSDVDLVIDIADDRKFSMLDLVGLGNLVEDELGVEGNFFMRRSLDRSLQRTFGRDGLKVF